MASALLLTTILGACGYRPVTGGRMPHDVRSVRLLQPRPDAVDEPQLSRSLVAEVTRQLALRGVRASSAGPAEALLRVRVLALTPAAAMISPGRHVVSARQLNLRVELWLRRARGGQTLWRSGIIEARTTWPLGQDSLASESARRQALGQLAADAARQGVELMTSGF